MTAEGTHLPWMENPTRHRRQQLLLQRPRRSRTTQGDSLGLTGVLIEETIGIEAAVQVMNQASFLDTTATSTAPEAGPLKIMTGHAEVVAMAIHSPSIGCLVEVAVATFTVEDMDQVEAMITITGAADPEVMECTRPTRNTETTEDMGTDAVGPTIQKCEKMVVPCPRLQTDTGSHIPIEDPEWLPQRAE